MDVNAYLVETWCLFGRIFFLKCGYFMRGPSLHEKTVLLTSVLGIPSEEHIRLLEQGAEEAVNSATVSCYKGRSLRVC